MTPENKPNLHMKPEMPRSVVRTSLNQEQIAAERKSLTEGKLNEYKVVAQEDGFPVTYKPSVGPTMIFEESAVVYPEYGVVIPNSNDQK